MKKTVLCLVSAVLAASLAAAQTKPAAAKTAPKEQTIKSDKQPTPKPEKQEQRVPEPPPQPVNVKIEFTITDQTGPGEPAKKVVSMIAGDRQNASIRSTANVRVTEEAAPNVPVTNWHYEEVRINVDARPILLKDGKISLSFGLEYLPTTASGGTQRPSSRLSSLNERMGLIVESAKPMIVSQAADPASDRRITVELLATLLK
jgi:glucose/arabinose dehydrogenase